MKTTRRAFIAAVMVAASAIVMGAQTRATEPAQSSLANTEWTLSQIEGEAPLDGRDLDLKFAEDGRFGTSAGCNRFMGQVEIEGEEIIFPNNIAGTMMACPKPLADQEAKVLSLFSGVSSYRVEPEALILMNDEGQELLRYSRLMKTSD